MYKSLLTRFKGVKSKNNGNYGSIIFSSIFGVICIFLILLAFSFLVERFNVPNPLLSIISVISISFGAFIGGYTAGFKKRKNGLTTGIVAGIITYILVMIIGALISNFTEFSFLTKLIIMIIFGAIGGVLGVNAKKKY